MKFSNLKSLYIDLHEVNDIASLEDSESLSTLLIRELNPVKYKDIVFPLTIQRLYINGISCDVIEKLENTQIKVIGRYPV